MTTTTEIIDPRAVETLMLDGDLGKLDAAQRIQFYAATCDRVGLDPVARPFDYLRLNGKVVLYANKSCAEQLRQLHNISLGEVRTEVVNDTFIATVTASCYPTAPASWCSRSTSMPSAVVRPSTRS